MLTEEQLGVIEKIPVQGSLVYTFDGKNYTFTQGQVDEAVHESFIDRPRSLSMPKDRFTDKIPPREKKAWIMMGAPGSGKTEYAMSWYEALSAEEKQGIVLVGYNEGGAEENFQPFMDAVSEVTGDYYEKKLKITNQFQPVTQRIQNETQRKALREEFSVMVDITAERKGAGKLIDVLRTVGYESIELIGMHASFDIARHRAEDRFIRPTSPIDIIDKRIGVLGYYEEHAKKCDRFDMYTNNYELPPQKVFSWKPGSNAHDVDVSAVYKMCDSLTADIDDVRQYLKKIKRRPDCKTKVDVDEMMTAYKDAANTAIGFFQHIAETGKPKEPEYAFGK